MGKKGVVRFPEQQIQCFSWWENQKTWESKKEFANSQGIGVRTLTEYFGGRSSPKGERRVKLFEATKLSCFAPATFFGMSNANDEEKTVVPKSIGTDMSTSPILLSKYKVPISKKNPFPSQQIDVSVFFDKIVADGFCLGKKPFFVLGAGVSDGIVPYLNQMAEWLVKKLEESVPEETDLIDQGRSIINNKALRNDAAEFFCTIQDTEIGDKRNGIWRQFSESLVEGPFIVPDSSTFKGLLQLEANDTNICHRGLAGLLSSNACHVLNLNFDPLLFRAFEGFRDSSDDQNQTPKFNLIALHEPKDISRYFGSPENSFQPAASSARGDIFYVRCQNKNCPSFDLVRPLTTDKQTCDPKDKIHPFKCVACHLETLKLELSFPSYHTKEQLIQPLLSQLQEYLATQTSAIIIIGLSGKWDPYLLAGLFHWADIHSTPIIDVKPKPEDLLDESDMFIDKFRYLYFPGVPNSSTSQDLSGYYRYISKGDPFMMRLYSVIENCGIKLPKLQSLTRTTEVTNVK